MVVPLVGSLVKETGEFIRSEAQFITTMDKDVVRLRNELQQMQIFLDKADVRCRSGKRSDLWVRDTRIVAYEVEDLLELFILEMERSQQKQRGCIGSLISYAHLLKQNLSRQKLNRKIEFLRAEVNDILMRRYTLGMADPRAEEEESRHIDEEVARLRGQVVLPVDSIVVGMEDEKKRIMDMLLCEHVKQRSVISIIGMGGLGKTTLALNILKDPKICSHFNRIAWVHVTQRYKDEQLLKELILQLSNISKEELEKMTYVKLRTCLRRSLLVVRYLVVMDDVWNNDLWNIVEQCLPDERNGSRVLITTREYRVAKPAKHFGQPYQLRFLNEEESLELFLKKAIPKNYPLEFEELGRHMVKKCGGLPLALAVIGDLIYLEGRSTTEWSKVARSFIGQDYAEGKICMKILALSYDNLPKHLQRCFLYLGAFPENAKIDVQKLMRLWIAEGFVEEDEYLTLEETAEEYLEQLVHKCLVQVVEGPWHNIKKCSIHRLLHELVITKTKELDFFHHLDRSDALPSTALFRRLSLKMDANEFLPQLPFARGLRTLLGFNFDLRPTSLRIMELKLLKVIDLEGAPILNVPNQIGDLANLRYMGLRNTLIEFLPDSVKKLSFLQTLDIRETMIRRLNNAFWAIKTLRHILTSMSVDLRSIHKGSLQNLQVLEVAMASNWIYTDLCNLRSLKTLRLKSIENNHHGELSIVLPMFSSLTTLELEGQSLPAIVVNLSSLCNLKRLILSGRIQGYPQNLGYQWPFNLSVLELTNTQLDVDPLLSLGSLHLLRVLKLANAYKGKEMTCRGDTFLELRTMAIYGLKNVEKWTLDDGAMPFLMKLEIHCCWKLVMLPQGLKSLASLKELRFLNMSSILHSRINKKEEEEEEEDWESIRHIPSIKFNNIWICGHQLLGSLGSSQMGYW